MQIETKSCSTKNGFENATLCFAAVALSMSFVFSASVTSLHSLKIMNATDYANFARDNFCSSLQKQRLAQTEVSTKFWSYVKNHSLMFIRVEVW